MYDSRYVSSVQYAYSMGELKKPNQCTGLMHCANVMETGRTTQRQPIVAK